MYYNIWCGWNAKHSKKIKNEKKWGGRITRHVMNRININLLALSNLLCRLQNILRLFFLFHVPRNVIISFTNLQQRRLSYSLTACTVRFGLDNVHICSFHIYASNFTTVNSQRDLQYEEHTSGNASTFNKLLTLIVIVIQFLSGAHLTWQDLEETMLLSIILRL